MDPQEKINILRNKIDDLDNQILDFLVQRFSISREIGEIKASSGIEIRDLDREKEIIERLVNKLAGKTNGLFEYSRFFHRNGWETSR